MNEIPKVGINIPKADMQRWINALRSGNYKQGREQLNYEDKFCCLGVACDLFIDEPELWNENNIAGFMPSNQPAAPEWLKEVSNDFFYQTGRGLTELNDSREYTFDDIADLLQAVYIEGVLDEETTKVTGGSRRKAS